MVHINRLCTSEEFNRCVTLFFKSVRTGLFKTAEWCLHNDTIGWLVDFYHSRFYPICKCERFIQIICYNSCRQSKTYIVGFINCIIKIVGPYDAYHWAEESPLERFSSLYLPGRIPLVG